MKIDAKKAGTAHSKSVHSISLKLAHIIMPTIIKTGAVACAGTRPAAGAMMMAKRNIIAVTTEVRPVRPPAPIPAALST